MKSFNLTKKRDRIELAEKAVLRTKYTALVNAGGQNKRLTVQFNVSGQCFKDGEVISYVNEVLLTVNRIPTSMSKAHFLSGNYSVRGLPTTKKEKKTTTKEVNERITWDTLTNLFKTK